VVCCFPESSLGVEGDHHGIGSGTSNCKANCWVWVDPSAAKVINIVDGNSLLINIRGSLLPSLWRQVMASNDGLSMMEAMESMLPVDFLKSGWFLWPMPGLPCSHVEMRGNSCKRKDFSLKKKNNYCFDQINDEAIYNSSEL
jgi:hypothetical protein